MRVPAASDTITGGQDYTDGTEEPTSSIPSIPSYFLRLPRLPPSTDLRIPGRIHVKTNLPILRLSRRSFGVTMSVGGRCSNDCSSSISPSRS
jgi:hypothetical protein